MTYVRLLPTNTGSGDALKPTTRSLLKSRVKGTELVTEPAGPVTMIGPLNTLFVGTRACSVVLSAGCVNAAGTPPKLTAVTSRKLFPEIVTLVPGNPFVGVKLLITGRA